MSDNTTSAAIEEFICYIKGNRFPWLSEINCVFAHVTLFLYEHYFGYISLALLLLIAVISIFGKIKGDYRWFILNQVVWDMAFTYGYLRNHKIREYVYTQTVYYSLNTQTWYFDYLLDDIIDTNPFTSLLLLSWSRFLAMYFQDFYDCITANKRIFITIIGFNLFVFFFHISQFLRKVRNDTRARLNLYCIKNKLAGDCLEWLGSDPVYILASNVYHVFRIIILIKPFIFLILSIFAAVMIIYKIGKQAGYQLKHNRRDFFASSRVVAVIVLQSAINCLLVFVELTENIDDIFKDIWDIDLVLFGTCDVAPHKYARVCIDSIQLPEWLSGEDFSMGLENDTIYPAFKQLRIFLESIIIIVLMAGYREAIFSFFRYLYRLVRKPKVDQSKNGKMLFVNRSSLGPASTAS